MGCCAELRERKEDRTDRFSEGELALGLHHLRIKDFSRALIEQDDSALRNVEDLGESFSGSAFGSKLMAAEDNSAKRLLRHELFRSGKHFDKYHLLALGLLYARGTTPEKVDAIFNLYDMNDDGYLYTTALRRLLKDTILIAGVLVPALITGTKG